MPNRGDTLTQKPLLITNQNFKKMKKTKMFIFYVFALLFSIYGQAQTLTIKGKVLDENGLPTPGATMLVILRVRKQ
jgi:hypothetical protein